MCSLNMYEVCERSFWTRGVADRLDRVIHHSRLKRGGTWNFAAQAQAQVSEWLNGPPDSSRPAGEVALRVGVHLRRYPDQGSRRDGKDAMRWSSWGRDLMICIEKFLFSRRAIHLIPWHNFLFFPLSLLLLFASPQDVCSVRSSGSCSYMPRRI
jgi:hypothetical protein